MKTFLSILALVALTAFAPSVKAATWNDAFGMGNPNDDWLISGSAQRNNVISNVRSNYLYWVGSARDGGVPRITGANWWSDNVDARLEVWVATNVSTITNISLSPGTNNVFYLEGTNMLAASDVCVYRHVATDTYQMIVLTNNTAGIYAAPVVSYTALTNAQAVGDKIYKMALVQSIRPLRADTTITNGVNSLILATNYYVLPKDTTIAGKLGLPLMVGAFVTNHLPTWINVSGEYYVRPRR